VRQVNMQTTEKLKQAFADLDGHPVDPESRAQQLKKMIKFISFFD
jgi:hypothetical protein